MANILEVKNLKVSFRTTGGTVKAVRDISFDLEKGKTLAIVGESGSGKSVTSKSILGILAGNSIIEGGEILYDGKDLLKITEEDMCEIRGDKISMIFQDPLSALNPIVKIGRQITEAMLLKNKVSRKNARKAFNSEMAVLKQNMIAAGAEKGKSAEEISALVQQFDKISIASIKVEQSFDAALAANVDLLSDVEEFLFKAEKKQNIDVKSALRSFLSGLKKIEDPILQDCFGERGKYYTEALTKERNEYKAEKDEKGNLIIPEHLIQTLTEMRSFLQEASEVESPDFFAIGFADMEGKKDYDFKDISKTNAMLKDYCNEKFLNRFSEEVADGLRYAYRKSAEKKQAVLPVLAEAKKFFASGNYDEKTALKYAATVSDQVEDSINHLDLVKDSTAYTYRSSTNHAIRQLFFYEKNNEKEEKRFARQTAAMEKKKKSGKGDYKVVPKNVLDLEVLRKDIVSITEGLYEKYSKQLPESEVDFETYTKDLLQYFREKASDVVYKITRQMAKEKAIKLMEEVGIPEPRTRYYQYPFEFSGGMRQRIVIAIALAANPDILICDEPTTALDVTIQSQILELINKLKEERHLSIIFITHDLGVVANMADDIAVMYAGKIVEYGSAEEVFYSPAHPYTWALLSSMPDLDTHEKLDAIPGTPPNMIYPPVGDAFAERNKYAMDIDFEKQPPMFRITDTHAAATWLLHPDAPKVAMPSIIADRIERMKKKNAEVMKND